MQFHIIPPCAELAPYVRHYWVLESCAEEGNIRERVVSNDSIELMFHYRKPFQSLNAANEVSSQPQSIISGLNNSWFDVSTQGAAGAIAVSFLPGTAYNFFRFPLVDIAGKNLHLADVIKHEAMHLEEKIGNATSIQQRVKTIEQFLLKRIHPMAMYDSRLINQGITYIKQYGGQIRAYELSQKLSITPKSLERKFATYVGKSPKQFIKIIRLQEAMKYLSAAHPGSLTQFALANGYFDQSHFIKDFKTWSGYTPKELLSQKHGTDIPKKSDHF